MIEIIREWKSSWNPIVEDIIGLIIFLGGYSLLMYIGSMISEKLDKDKDNE